MRNSTEQYTAEQRTKHDLQSNKLYAPKTAFSYANLRIML